VATTISIPLFYDLDLRKWTVSAGSITEQKPIVIGQGSIIDFNVKFVQSGAVIELTSPTWIFGIKAINDHDGDYLVQTTTATKTGTGTTTNYKFSVTIDSTELRAFLADAEPPNNFCALEIKDTSNGIPTLAALTTTVLPDYNISGTTPTSANGTLIVAAGKTATISNTVTLTGTDGTSYNLDGNVRHDIAQTLTAGQKLQAVTNQGLNLTASKLLGQASSGGTGLPVSITLGTGLSMSGTTLNAAGGSGDMILASVQSVTGLKTFDTTKLAVKGSSTGTTAIASANSGATNYTVTLQAGDGTIAFTSDIPSESQTLTTSTTLTTSHAGKYLRLVASNGIVLTVPTNAAQAIPINSVIDIGCWTIGESSIVASNGVTINSELYMLGLAYGKGARLKKVGTDEWDLIGDITFEWTPASIPDLVLFLQLDEAHCYADYPPTALCGDGDTVRYVEPSFGTAVYAEQATSGSRPTMRIGGINPGVEFDVTDDFLQLVGMPVLDGPFTIYLSGLVNDTGQWMALGNSTLDTLAGSAGTPSLFDDGSGTVIDPTARSGTGFILRAYSDGTDAALTTAIGGSVVDTAGPFTFQRIGSTTLGLNGDTANRYRTLIAINREIAFNSPEDLLIRAWLKQNDGAMIEPLDLSEIPDLLLALDFTAANCVKSGGGTPSNGDTVQSVNGAFGTSINPAQAAAGSRPTFVAAAGNGHGGLSFGEDGVGDLKYLELNDTLEVGAEFTVYAVVDGHVNVTQQILLSNVGGAMAGTAIGSGPYGAVLFSIGQFSQFGTDVPSGLNLVRLLTDDLGGGYHSRSLISTGDTLDYYSDSAGPVTIDYIGASPADFFASSSADQSLVMLLIVARAIAYDSPEDRRIRQRIQQLTGATLNH